MERERKNKCAETGRKTGFLAEFGPDFLLPQAIKSTSIQGGGRGQSCLQWRKISALDSDGRIPTVGSK
jgi:hypothetical protein